MVFRAGGRRASLNQNLKKILFLTSEAPHTAAAGSIVFYRLFSDYPSELLHVITNHLPPDKAGRLTCQYKFLPLAADRLNRTRFWPWRAALRALGASRLVRLSKIDRLLNGFVPDLVATLMQDCWYYDLAARYATAHKLPLVLFCHDLADGFEPVPACLKKRQHIRDRAVYRQAVVRLCISQPMEAHFAQKFGANGEFLPPPRSSAPPGQEPEHCRVLKNQERLTLGYAGGLHYGYGEQLLAMLPVLRKTGTVVEVFGPEPTGPLQDLQQASDIFHFNGYASTPEDAARGLLEKCDAVLLPYLNPSGPHTRQYQTHFPSKLGDYLSLGLPLIVTGPADAAGVSWCIERSCALAVTNPTPAALHEALVLLRSEPELRTQLARAGQSAATYFDQPALADRMLTLLQGAHGNQSGSPALDLSQP